MYEFADLPLSPIEPATNVLVAGSGMSGAWDLFLRMLVPADDEGVIVVTTGKNATRVLDGLGDAAPALDETHVGVVDAVSQQQGVESESGQVRTVSSPSDLTGIGIELTDLYEAFYDRGVTDVRTGLESISTLLMYAELQTVFRFLHVFTGRVSTAEGLGVFVVDPSSHEEQTVQTLSQLFDARIDVREREGTRQLRVRGMPAQPDGWTEF